MKNNHKIIISNEISSYIFLAFLLLKKGFKVEIFKKYITQKIRHVQLFILSHSNSSLLEEFNIWSELENIAYLIESLLITDKTIFEKLFFSVRDLNFYKTISNIIGWVLNYADINHLLLRELLKFKNVFSDKSNNFNFEIRETNNYSISNKKSFFIPFLNNSRNSSIEFNDLLKVNFDNNLYTIIRKYGHIFICPLYKNIFRIKLFINDLSLFNRLTHGNNLLQDNLSTIIPKELKIYQIFDDLRFLIT